jgi:HrpA-like RNA helicase
MTVREYKRICKQAKCGEVFIVSAPSIDEDRAIGLSEPEYCPKHRALHARSYSRIACHHYEIELTREGEDLVRLIEKQKLDESEGTAELKGKEYDPWTMPGDGFGPGGLGRFKRPFRAFIENKEHENRVIPFQIAEKKDELLAALEDHQVIVLVGTTGSGKSTYVPWLLLTGGVAGQLSKWARRGPICVTQPRIQATRQVPRFIANTLNGTSLGIGAQIGFSHSNEDAFDRRTRLIFKTDGKLINDIVSGAISNYSIIIIDEAHERSVNIDVILGLLKDQLYLYPHLRLIIASATINHKSFIEFFGGPERVPFIFSEGRRHPITEHWWGEPGEEWWKKINNGVLPTRDQFPQAIADLVQYLCKHMDELPPDRKKQEDGHILVFLPGTREIDQTVSAIKAYDLPNVEALPLYAQRPLDEQESALNPDPKRHPNVYGKRRVVVSTNVAETSLTVEGVKYVIETGYIKESYWNPSTEISELQTVRHSQAGCKQRWGRAGRVSPGHTYMLYTRKQFEETFPKDSTPALARSSLEQVLLTAKTGGARTAKRRDGTWDKERVLDFAWIPLARDEDARRFKDEMRRAYESLVRQKAIDEQGDLTRFGLELRGMPAAMDVARIFTEGELHSMGIEVATLLPFLKLEYGLQGVLLWKKEWPAYEKLSIRQSHLDIVYGCRDDLEMYLKLWMLWESYSEQQRREWEDTGGVSYKSFQESIENERRKLLETAMDWRKAENRKIAIQKIDALRALIAHCLPQEIYTPLENAPREDTSSHAHRFREPDTLAWESYWEGTDQYEEYDEEITIDPSYAEIAGGRSGVYCRLNQLSAQADESALIEIAPTSVCFDRTDTELLVACQRRANFRRPARAKVLGMNMIRLERGWLEAIQGSVVQRTLLYASLSRRRDPADYQNLNIRLFLPWLLPRGSQVRGTVRKWEPDKGVYLEITVTPPATMPMTDLREMRLSLQGWLPVEETSVEDQAHADQGSEISAEVLGYAQTETGEPLVRLGRPRATIQAVQKFAKLYRAGMSIEVEMRQVLEDPLGRSPMFIVREPISGLEIPMADSDFCGGTHAYPYFGRRFGIGDRFDVQIEEMYPEEGHVYLSRGHQLLREYARIPFRDFLIVEVIVKRVESLGVYLAIPGTSKGSPYVGFVRRALWPLGFDPKPGDRVRARLRRQDRHINAEKMEQRLKDGQPLPEELDLGVDLDLRVPLVYDRFRKQQRLGDLITVTVEKPLDSGGLLISLIEGLKGMIYESELGLDENGLLKSARAFPPGKTIDVRVTQMQDDTATVRCSIFRVLPLPFGLEAGQVVEARVLAFREDVRDENLLRLTCSLDDQYQVQAQAPVDALDQPLEVGQAIQVRIDRVDTRVNLILGTMESVSEDVDYGTE